MDKKLIIKDNKLHEKDNIDQTFGCRHSNPDICNNNGVIGKCAFESEDCICKVPPKSWKRKYLELLKKNGSSDKNV